ncbi:MAG: mechanosensitive ion channel domain-containing protein [Candidatus Nealsonbacteria bacterium]
MDIQVLLQTILDWFVNSGIRIIIILIIAFSVDYLSESLLEKVIKKIVKDKKLVDNKRTNTLISVFGGTLKFIIWIIILLMILSEFGIDIAPILAGVGLMGLAVGMAAKDIISDFISGLFILLEDHYHIGDQVKVAGIEGNVKEITLRRTILEDVAGIKHSIPNSQIKIVAKKTS